jgi:hypothetical protein
MMTGPTPAIVASTQQRLSSPPFGPFTSCRRTVIAEIDRACFATFAAM